MVRGQIWSVDLAIGMLVFLLAIGTIYSLLNAKEAQDVSPLRIESEVVATVLTTGANSPELRVATENQLNMEALGDLAAKDYNELKTSFGIENDFCIFLEDEDGNLIYIENNGELYAGIGPNNGDLNLASDTPCGKKV